MFIVLDVLNKQLEGKYPILVKYTKEFSKSAIDFQVKTGLIANIKNLDSLHDSLVVQTEQVLEEMQEFLDAVNNDDKVEAVDGLVDVLFTGVNFDFIVQAINNIEENTYIVNDSIDKVVSAYEYCVNKVLNKFFDMNVDEKDIINSAKLIEVNNSNKYTYDLQEAINWGIDLSDGLATHIVATPVNDGVYFCLKDKNGKVRKHKNFNKVDLGWLNNE